MPGWLIAILSSVGSVLISLTVTFIFNKVVGIPKELKKQREAEAAKEEKLKLENQARDAKIASLEAAVNALPGYRLVFYIIVNFKSVTSQNIGKQ